MPRTPAAVSPDSTRAGAARAAEAEGLRKAYGAGEARVVALDGVTVGFERGRFTAIMGPSGSGKSTLLHCLAGLDGFDGGCVRLGGVELAELGERELTRLRRERVGFVFQAYNLLSTLTVWENVTLPVALGGGTVDRRWAAEVVDAVGLAGRLAHRPAELSGGQQQRVAVARALVSRPEVVFADEPTGNLDSVAGGEVLRLLRSAAGEWGQSVVMVTHDPVAASYADRVVFLADGRLADELHEPTAEAVLTRMRTLGAARRER